MKVHCTSFKKLSSAPYAFETGESVEEAPGEAPSGVRSVTSGVLVVSMTGGSARFAGRMITAPIQTTG
jgi:hypothetical protein